MGKRGGRGRSGGKERGRDARRKAAAFNAHLETEPLLVPAVVPCIPPRSSAFLAALHALLAAHAARLNDAPCEQLEPRVVLGLCEIDAPAGVRPHHVEAEGPLSCKYPNSAHKG